MLRPIAIHIQFESDPFIRNKSQVLVKQVRTQSQYMNSSASLNLLFQQGISIT